MAHLRNFGLAIFFLLVIGTAHAQPVRLGPGTGLQINCNGTPGWNALMVQRSALPTPINAQCIPIDNSTIQVQNGILVAPGGSSTTYYQTVQDEGSSLTQRGTLNFAGAGVTCADATTKTTCTIPSGGVSSGTSLPATCTAGDLYSLTTPAASVGLYTCVAANTWLAPTVLQNGPLKTLGVSSDTEVDTIFTSATNGTNIVNYRSSGGSIATPTATTTNIQLGVFAFQLYDSGFFSVGQFSGTAKTISGSNSTGLVKLEAHRPGLGTGWTTLSLNGDTHVANFNSPLTVDTSLAIGGCTIGSNAFCATGHTLIEGVTSTGATGTGNIVYGSSPTIVTPTIASFVNATHDHTNAAGGGTIAYSAITGTPTLYNQTIQDEGSSVTQRSVMNFVGAGVAVTDSGGKTTVTIGGGGTGCVPASTVGKILVDDGAGGCTSTTPTISGSTITATLAGLSSTSTALATPRAIYGNNFDGTAALTQIIASTYGGTGNGFAKLSGPATTEKTFTLPNASAAILTDNAAVTVPQGGTGIASGTSGGALCFTGSTTIASGGALTANLPVIGGGAGACPAVGTRSGNTTAYVTTTGAQTSGDCVKIDANGNHIANGSACGGTGVTPSTRAAFASLPTCTGAIAGQMFTSTNTGITAQCGGAGPTWYYSYGQLSGITPTTTSISGTWFNQGGASVANIIGGVTLVGTSGTNNIRGRIQTLPSTPFTYTICNQVFLDAANATFPSGGIMLTDGTKVVVLGTQGDSTTDSAQLRYEKFDNATTFNAGYTLTTGASGSPQRCVGVSDDGTNRHVAVSNDNQIWLIVSASVLRTDFLTPTSIGYYLNGGNTAVTPTMNVISETVTASALF